MSKLVRALYGTRDAPLAWQGAVKGDMSAFGFEECKVTTGVFTHRARDLRAVAHVDDFLVSGEMYDLAWYVQIARWERGGERDESFLGRTIRTTTFGVELEGDEKHVKKLEEEWGWTIATRLLLRASNLFGFP